MDAQTFADAAQIPLERAARWLEHLLLAMDVYAIRKPKQQAAFIAQLGHESMGFQRTEENLRYSTPERIRAVWPFRFRSVVDARPFVRNPEGLANFVYSNRGGNGDAFSGDGWRYRGRGLLQITLKDNYRAAQIGMELPLLATPDLLKLDEYAAASAAWWWHEHGLNDFADVDEIDKISGVINRGDPDKVAVGEDERREAYVHALMILDGSDA
jgi:putative chitinase